MKTRERLAYDAGLRAALDMARIVAITVETAAGAAGVRKQAAAGALHAFADAARALALTQTPTPGLTVMAAIAKMPGGSDEIPCLECSGRFHWSRDSANGHLHGGCDAGCLTVMQ